MKFLQTVALCDLVIAVVFGLYDEVELMGFWLLLAALAWIVDFTERWRRR